MKPPLVLTLGLWLLLAAAACGGGPARAASTPPAARPTPSPAAPAPPADPSPTSPAQTATASRPLAIVSSPNGMVAAVSPDGVFAWSFDPGHLGITKPALVTNGPNLLAYGGGSVAVIDRSGTVIGRGTAAADQPIFPAPTGLSWAWTTVDSTTEPPAPQTSSLWVAGVGQRPSRVRTWTGGYTVSASQWSDAGIVVVRLGPSCGAYPQSSSLVDPATGGEASLFGDGRWPLDVHAGIRVAKDADEPTVYVTGRARITRSYQLPVVGAGIDPSGTRLFVSTFGETGCGGRIATATSVVDVASNSQTMIDRFLAEAWLDDQHLLGRTVAAGPAGQAVWGPDVLVADLSGHESSLAVGTLVGVLRPQGSAS